MTCKCGKFENALPVIDFIDRVSHFADDCPPFPGWTKFAPDDEYIINHGPWGWGIDRGNYFRSEEQHPANCPCGDPRSKKHGDVCFIPNRGVYTHIEGLKIDWERVKYLTTLPRRSK